MWKRPVRLSNASEISKATARTSPFICKPWQTLLLMTNKTSPVYLEKLKQLLFIWKKAVWIEMLNWFETLLLCHEWDKILINANTRDQKILKTVNYGRGFTTSWKTRSCDAFLEQGPIQDNCSDTVKYACLVGNLVFHRAILVRSYVHIELCRFWMPLCYKAGLGSS